MTWKIDVIEYYHDDRFDEDCFKFIILHQPDFLKKHYDKYYSNKAGTYRIASVSHPESSGNVLYVQGTDIRRDRDIVKIPATYFGLALSTMAEFGKLHVKGRIKLCTR